MIDARHFRVTMEFYGRNNNDCWRHQQLPPAKGLSQRRRNFSTWLPFSKHCQTQPRYWRDKQNHIHIKTSTKSKCFNQYTRNFTKTNNYYQRTINERNRKKLQFTQNQKLSGTTITYQETTSTDDLYTSAI